MTRVRAEAMAWLFVRLSGVALLFLVLGHMLLMHVLVGVNAIDFAFVSARWTGAGWRTYDLAMLLLAMPHAALGLRGMAAEHLPRSVRSPLLGTGYLVCAVLTGLGTWVIFTFQRPI
jgi:succinate dehydrogenase / fumarate reductase membrane anchor subunit